MIIHSMERLKEGGNFLRRLIHSFLNALAYLQQVQVIAIEYLLQTVLVNNLLSNTIFNYYCD